MEFKNKTVVVTGAARGIGKNMALKFSQAGAEVVAIDIQSFEAKDPIHTLNADLQKTGEADALIRTIISEFGGIDVLVNNARAGERTKALCETETNWDKTMEVGLKAPFFLSQALIRNAPNSGAILNISSVSGGFISHESAAYHVSKAGLENMTRYLAVMGGEKGFRVNAIRPGFIVQDEHQERFHGKDNLKYRTKANQCHPMGEIGSSNDVAHAALFLCSPLAKFITGQVLTIDGGLTLQDPWDVVNHFK